MNSSVSVSENVQVTDRKMSGEFYIHAVVSILMLSAGLLSIPVENSFAPVAEGQSTIYLAMMQ